MSRLRHQRHTAFSLIELLVVIAIIAVLVGLLLAAVQKVREVAARAQSSHHLHQLSVAMQHCQNEHGYLPPGFGYFPAGPSDPTLSGGRSGYGNLFFHLLPFVEQGNLYQSTAGPGNGSPPNRGTLYSPFGPTFPGIAPHPIEVYQNPSDPTMSGAGTVENSQTVADGWGACGYAFNAQVFCRVDGRGNFLDWFGNPKFPGRFADGTSNTIVFTEKYAVCGPPGGLYSGANAWAEAPDEQATPVFSVSRFPSAGTPAGAIPATGAQTHFQVQPTDDECQYWVPQTARAEGILVGMADGSVRTVGSEISSATWWAASTPAGREVLGNDW
jgi:prepilin-type N-terminal cleavage/methylation domain-containing protein